MWTLLPTLNGGEGSWWCRCAVPRVHEPRGVVWYRGVHPAIYAVITRYGHIMTYPFVPWLEMLIWCFDMYLLFYHILPPGSWVPKFTSFESILEKTYFRSAARRKRRRALCPPGPKWQPKQHRHRCMAMDIKDGLAIAVTCSYVKMIKWCWYSWRLCQCKPPRLVFCERAPLRRSRRILGMSYPKITSSSGAETGRGHDDGGSHRGLPWVENVFRKHGETTQKKKSWLGKSGFLI